MILKLAKLMKSVRGSYTLEAAIVFPIMIMLLIGLMFLSTYVYQKFAVLDAAIYVSTQRADTWDNSKKDLETGRLSEDNSDGLYWRIFDDFSGTNALDGNLVGKKLKQAVSSLEPFARDGLIQDPVSYTNTGEYKNRIVDRIVSLRIEQGFAKPGWPLDFLGGQCSTYSQAHVCEPVESLRIASNCLGLLDNPVYVTDSSQYFNIPKVYHTRSNCRYVPRIMRNNNLIVLPSAAEAEANGYRQCKYCAREK